MTDTPATSVPAAQTIVEKPATAPVATPAQNPTTAPAPAAQATPVAPNPAVTPPTTQSPVPTPSPAAAPVVAAPVAQTAPESVKNPPVVNTDEPEAPKMDELAYLKQRATLMGITFSNNIGVDALRQKIDAKLNGEAEQTQIIEDEEEALPETAPQKLAKPAQTLRQRLLQDNMRLVRVRITNLDPKKKDLPGEIIAVANRYIGTVRKFVPYGEVTEGGYHIPYVIFKLLKKRKFLNIRTRKNPNGRGDIVEHNYVPEFAIEELPPLTEAELNRLAQAQIAAGSVEA